MAARKKKKIKALSLYSKFRESDARARMGRPPIEINQEAFEELCMNQMPLKSICIVLRACDDTINQWCKKTYNETFSATWKIFATYRKNRLATVLFDTAMGNRNRTIATTAGVVSVQADPDASLLKFLAKNLLDMSESGPKDVAADASTVINNNTSGSLNADIKVEVEYVQKQPRSDLNDEWKREEYDNIYNEDEVEVENVIDVTVEDAPDVE